MARPGLVYSATADMVCAEMTAQIRWIDMHPGMLRAVTVMVVVGSEEAPIEGLASVRHSNGTCGFPAFRFHEWPREVRREGSVRQGYLAHQRVDLLLLTFERQMIG